MKKIYFINCTYGHGGPGDVAKNLFNYFKTNGYACRFACSRYGENNLDFYKIGNKIDTYLHYGFSMLFDNEGFNSRVATCRLISDIKKFNPDIINLHSLIGHYINYKILFTYLKKSNVKVIWTLHDCSPFTGHCINFERINCEKWKECCCNCELKKDYPKSVFFDNSKRNYIKKKNLFKGLSNMMLVTPSIWLKKYFESSFLKNYSCNVIYNGIDLNSFKYTKSNFKETYNLGGKKILLFVAGIWNEMKGINIVKDFADIVEDNYKIVLIGKCSHELNKNILHIDRTSDRVELAKWYSLASVFVNPTLGDNFPTVNIEALACGTPIVTFRTGGSPEAINDKTGVVVDKKNAFELFKGVKKCEEMINKGIISKNSCVEKSKENDIESFSKKYLGLISDFCGE